MKTIVLTWLLALIAHNYGWQNPFHGDTKAATPTEAVKTGKGELLQVGTDALLLFQEGTRVTNFFVLQDAAVPTSGLFSNQHFNFTAQEGLVNVTLSDGTGVCLKNEGVPTRDGEYGRVVEGGGLAYYQFHVEADYKRFVELLTEYKNYKQALDHFDYELHTGGGGGGGNTRTRAPKIPISTACGDCASGGYGTVGCTVQLVGYSCSVSCPPNTWACCTAAGGCRCCR